MRFVSPDSLLFCMVLAPLKLSWSVDTIIRMHCDHRNREYTKKLENTNKNLINVWGQIS